MNQFRFANIEWLHAMWIVLGLALLLVALELRGGRIMDRLLSPLMQSRLVKRPSLARRLWSVLLLCACLTALVLALMRPQWGSTVQLQTRVDSQIMICLDVSRSMLAEDVVPNRLERAQAEIDSLLSLMRDGQQVGLLAFAGKASVLCPLTTDFGFLRMILAEANPATVGLGGTRIGEAILKAVDGFRDVGDVNRLILLITDGEDHDSFPLDAAQAAQEKGIRIVSIGFGDELGSKIEITDPRTGARSYVEDRDGAAVISRLDGETLREIALKTEGAYIPAGTGALDWQSIYSAHIAGFLRGSTAEEETVVRNEAYQWCVLAALLLLLGSLAAPTLFIQEQDMDHLLHTARTSASRAAVWLMLGVQLISGPTAMQTMAAQTVAPPVATAEDHTQAASDPPQADNHSDSLNDSAKSSTTKEELSADPRTLYNQAVAYVTSDPERAERLLNASRRAAGVDGELRYRALYNLGWVEIQRAEGLLQPEPAQALKHLELAAGRFREAIRVRPESDDARHNLELISRRILELADSLAERDARRFAERLDELIARIRKHQIELQTMCGRVSAPGANVDSLRHEFRQLGVVQRQIISDFEKLSADARRQVTTAQSQAAASSSTQTNATAEQAVETAQLTAMLAYADSAVQRMHKSRSFIRRLQAERAFARWAASLNDAKRARDQLRDPLEVLGVLIADATEQQQLIRLMQWTSGQAPVDGQATIDKPSWLTTEVLADGQISTTERTEELFRLLSAGLEQFQSVPTVDPQTDPSQEQPSQEFMAQLQAALPVINRASQHFEQAQQSIANQDWPITLEQQTSGISALIEAAEVFYDVRRLIDATLADQRGISAALISPPESAALDRTAVRSTQEKNLTRIERLAEMFIQQLNKINSAAAEPKNGSGVDSSQLPADAEAHHSAVEQAAAEKERFELAETLRRAAEEAMQGILSELSPSKPAEIETVPDPLPELERPPSPRRRPPDSTQTQSAVTPETNLAAKNSTAAVAALEELQRLFFSVIEHLKHTAERQTELNDHTTELLAQPDQLNAARVGSLQLRQQTLEGTSQEIADALTEQATRMQAQDAPAEEPAVPATAPTEAAEPESLSEPEKFLQAAELVRAGAQAMSSAQTALAEVAHKNSSPTGVDTPAETQPTSEPLVRAAQDQQLALQKLQEALTLLNPPPSENQNQNQQQQQQPEERSDEKTESNPQNMDAEQMLQAIREREAKRRRERQPQTSAAAGVEKDW
jgi:hypothetical protein